MCVCMYVWPPVGRQKLAMKDSTSHRHTHTHTYTRIHTYTYRHTYIHTDIHTYTHTYLYHQHIMCDIETACNANIALSLSLSFSLFLSLSLNKTSTASSKENGNLTKWTNGMAEIKSGHSHYVSELSIHSRRPDMQREKENDNYGSITFLFPTNL